MQLTHPERRALARFPLKVFVRIRARGGEQVHYAETRNISACGIYLHTLARLQVDEHLECVLILPQELTLTPSPLLVGCRARVLRVDRLAAGTIGAAVEVNSYDFSWQEGGMLASENPS
jgi:hypothetical protein